MDTMSTFPSSEKFRDFDKPSDASATRLVLAPELSGRGMFDGGWWPRSKDPTVELPGLVSALDARVGTVFRIALNHQAWESAPRRITVAGHVIKLGWHGPSDAHMISVSGAGRDLLDLLVVPSDAAPEAAQAALATAADSHNTARATEILQFHGIDVGAGRCAVTPPATHPRPELVWEDEGGALLTRLGGTTRVAPPQRCRVRRLRGSGPPASLDSPAAPGRFGGSEGL